MRRTLIAAAVALGLFAVSTYAQQSNNSKRPNQTHDIGIDDDQPPGQARKGPGDRVVTQAPVTITATGTAVAELDETFDEALVLTLNPDGTRTYTEVKGLEAAEALVKSAPKPAPAVPALEEK